MKSLNKLTPTAIKTLNTIKEMLDFKPCTCSYVADEMGMTTSYVRECLSTLHRAGLTHISGWLKETHGVSAMYRLGAGADVRKPLPKNIKPHGPHKIVVKVVQEPIIWGFCPVHAAFYGARNESLPR